MKKQFYLLPLHGALCTVEQHTTKAYYILYRTTMYVYIYIYILIQYNALFQFHSSTDFINFDEAFP